MILPILLTFIVKLNNYYFYYYYYVYIYLNIIYVYLYVWEICCWVSRDLRKESDKIREKN